MTGEYYDQDEQILQEERLEPIARHADLGTDTACLLFSCPLFAPAVAETQKKHPQEDPANTILLDYLGSGPREGLTQQHEPRVFDPDYSSSRMAEVQKTRQVLAVEADLATVIDPALTKQDSNESRNDFAVDVGQTGRDEKEVVRSTSDGQTAWSSSRDLATRTRQDSTQLDPPAGSAMVFSDILPSAGVDKSPIADGSHSQISAAQEELDAPQRQNRTSPLKLQTSGTLPDVPEPEESITASPTLAKHVRPVPEGTVDTLRPLDSTSALEGGPNLLGERSLPSITQVMHSLPALAEAATREHSRQYNHQHSHSFGSATSQSPILSNHAFTPSSQTSPTAYNPYSALSPTSTLGDGHQSYASPSAPPYPTPYNLYAHRRPSAPTENPPRMPPSLPSASSSGESYVTSSSTEGYSTSHTTPIELNYPPENTPRLSTSMLPPSANMQQIGLYRCDYEGCTAPPFQTQYLLSSHRNVHSQSRPHYCPVEGCQRAEGGKGFKRKNEMIRHGLVHNSPGYICPFCPDREHRYPRPDNLQRHVRVHHVGKDKDDPLLRDVLSQRTGGQGKARRRRSNADADPAPP